MKKILMLCGLIVALQMTASAQWRYSKDTDKMTDKVTHKLTQQNKDARLEVHCSDKSASLLFFLSKGQLNVERMEIRPGITGPGSTVRLRFDKQPAQSENLMIADPHDRGGIFLSGADQLLNAKRLLIEYRDAEQALHVAEFNLVGLDNAAKQLPCRMR